MNLTVNISALRKALGQGYNEKGMIQTVPTRGYRFIAPVTTGDAALAGTFREDPAGELVERTPDAYRAYLQGRFHWNRRSEDDLIRGI